MSIFFRAIKQRFDLSLYLVTEPKSVKNDEQFDWRVERAIDGGVTCLQVRDPDSRNCMKTAARIKHFLDSRRIPLIINDHIEIAFALKTGLHIGQGDIPYHIARRSLGREAIIGLTVNSLDDVLAAQELDVDYLGLQVFPSKNTKPDPAPVWEIEGLKQARSLSRHRLVAIGGITPHNLKTVWSHLRPETDGVAMVGQLWRGEDPCAEAQKIRSIFAEN